LRENLEGSCFTDIWRKIQFLNNTDLFWNTGVAANPNKTHRAKAVLQFRRRAARSAEHSEDNFRKRRRQKFAAAPTRFSARAISQN
jgi:hypothetical protein